MRRRERREGDERVKGEQPRESTVPHMLRRHGQLNKLPPLKPPDSWERQTLIPREAGNAAEPRAREKEGSQSVEKKVQGEQRRGKKATTVGCPTQLLCRDDVRGHVTQALQ